MNIDQFLYKLNIAALYYLMTPNLKYFIECCLLCLHYIDNATAAV